MSRKFDRYEMIQLTTQKELLTEMMRLDLMVIRRSSGQGLVMTLQIQPTLIAEIKEAQKEDARLQKFKEQVGLD